MLTLLLGDYQDNAMVGAYADRSIKTWSNKVVPYKILASSKDI